MVKIISIQRIAGRGVVQFVRNGTATALRFDARLSDEEVRKLVADQDCDKKTMEKRRNVKSRKS